MKAIDLIRRLDKVKEDIRGICAVKKDYPSLPDYAFWNTADDILHIAFLDILEAYKELNK